MPQCPSNSILAFLQSFQVHLQAAGKLEASPEPVVVFLGVGQFLFTGPGLLKELYLALTQISQRFEILLGGQEAVFELCFCFLIIAGYDGIALPQGRTGSCVAGGKDGGQAAKQQEYAKDR